MWSQDAGETQIWQKLFEGFKNRTNLSKVFSIWAQVQHTLFFPISSCLQLFSLATSFLFTQAWPPSKKPLSQALICTLDRTKNRGTKIIWTKGRHALGFGPQPPCHRAKIADCPSVSAASICLPLCTASASITEGLSYTSDRRPESKLKHRPTGLSDYNLQHAWLETSQTTFCRTAAKNRNWWDLNDTMRSVSP